MTRLIAIAAALAVAAVLGGIWYVSRPDPNADQFAQCRASQVAGGTSQIGGPFELVNSKGETVTDKDVITTPSILYFGYTFCPDVCPLDNSRNVEAVEILEARGMTVTPIFISIDPKRDTPEVVGDFAYNHHDRMIGLTGSPEQVKAASQAYKTYYKAHPEEDGFYLVDHSTFSYLVLPEQGFVEYFKRGATPQEMADTVQCFVENM